MIDDPLFIGYCIEKNADCASKVSFIEKQIFIYFKLLMVFLKVVKKMDPEERLGVICRSNSQIKGKLYT